MAPNAIFGGDSRSVYVLMYGFLSVFTGTELEFGNIFLALGSMNLLSAYDF